MNNTLTTHPNQEDVFEEMFLQILEVTGQRAGEVEPRTAIRLLATSCPVGEMYNTINWTYVLTQNSWYSWSSNYQSNTVVCMPCPIGCQTCTNTSSSSSSSKCWNTNCTSCNIQFDLKKLDWEDCSSRYYCRCKNDKQYPDPVSGNCQACSSVIPHC